MSQLFGMFLGPLSRPDQAFLFRVPAAKHQRPARLPTLRQQHTNAMHRLQHGHGAAPGVDGAKHPRVAMIAGNHPLIGKLRTRDLADHVPHRAFRVVHLEPHVDFD